MARLHEHQGKQLLREAGLRTPEGGVAASPEQAEEVARRLGRPVAVKAQVWTTGRFKAGGVRFADSPAQARAEAASLLGSRLKGFRVEQVLVEERLKIAREYYAGVIVDASRKVRGPVVVFSASGGVDVESASADRIVRRAVDISRGLSEADAREMVASLDVPEPHREPLARAVAALYGVFRRYDARSAEINPLVVTEDGRVVAADCRVSIDDASAARHPELGILVPRESDTAPTPLDVAGWKIEESDYRGIAFFAQMAPDTRGGGYIGYHAIGGGGALLAADALVRHGLKLANYAETSGNPTAVKVCRTARLILSQPGLDGYCLMGAVLASQDQWHHAHGLVKAFREALRDRPGFPVVILIAGNKEAEALEILREGLSTLPIRLELYGRDHIHRLDSVAERMKALAEEYRAGKGRGLAAAPAPPPPSPTASFAFRTGRILVDERKCDDCRSLACVKACSLYGGYVYRVRGGKMVLGIPPQDMPRGCTECLACEHECLLRGRGALSIELHPLEGGGSEGGRRGHPAG
jgi:succinyl-CoA synthetase beta subunit